MLVGMTPASVTRAPDPSYRHVLLPLDGSDLAAGAAETARALAVRFGADVQTVSVSPSAAETDALRRHAAEVLDTDPSDVRLHVAVEDDPARAIHRLAEDLGSCLVCISTHGRGRVAGAVIGSVARSVLQLGGAPIVAVGPFADRPSALGAEKTAPLSVNQLVACVDGGGPSEQVLPVAAAWAHALGMSLAVVTVAEPSPPPLRTDATWHRHHGPQADAEEYLRQLGEKWHDVAPDVRTHVVYDPISAAEGIKAHLDAQPTGLVAVTTHGRTGLNRVVFGAGAAGIVHASTAPVLVVPLVE